jgi:hypothetical protein
MFKPLVQDVKVLQETGLEVVVNGKKNLCFNCG